MTSHFYVFKDGCYILLASKYIKCIPQLNTNVEYAGERYTVENIEFDLDLCIYHIYLRESFKI